MNTTKLETETTKKTFMNGNIFLLNRAIDVMIDEPVCVYKNNNWLILTIPKPVQIFIEDQVKLISSYHKPPYNQEGKLFLPSKKFSQINIWKSNKEKGAVEDLPAGRFSAKVKLSVNMFTEYKEIVSFKIVVTDICIVNQNDLCPF